MLIYMKNFNSRSAKVFSRNIMVTTANAVKQSSGGLL